MNYGRTGGKYLACKKTDYFPVICLWNKRTQKLLNDSISFPNKFYSINKNWDRTFFVRYMLPALLTVIVFQVWGI
jgi:hypothetical protein